MTRTKDKKQSASKHKKPAPPPKRKSAILDTKSRMSTLNARKIKKVFVLTAEKRRALELLFAGESVEATARQVGVTGRSVRNWRKEFAELFLENNADFIEVWTDTVRKSLCVIDKYLSGKGGLPGGDLQAALAILRGAHILQPDTKSVVNNSRNLLQYQRFDVRINQQVDQEFNNAVPAEFARMARILKLPAGTTGTDS